jgi:GTPase SAR1 family protein
MKILLLGDSATGKSAVTQRFVNGKFDPEHKPTVAVDFSQTTVTVGTQVSALHQLSPAVCSEWSSLCIELASVCCCY